MRPRNASYDGSMIAVMRPSILGCARFEARGVFVSARSYVLIATARLSRFRRKTELIEARSQVVRLSPSRGASVRKSERVARRKTGSGYAVICPRRRARTSKHRASCVSPSYERRRGVNSKRIINASLRRFDILYK